MNQTNQTNQANQTNQTEKKNSRPECFGVLEKVFPMTDMGLRQTPDYCFDNCHIKTKCLEYAMATKNGAIVEEEIVERGVKSGTINFFERWSRKKQAHNKINRQI